MPFEQNHHTGMQLWTPRQRTHTLISILLGHASRAKWGNSCAELQKKHSQRGCGCNFSSFDHADQMHALKGWNHHQPPTCWISLFFFFFSFFIEQMLSCKFLQGQQGQAPPGFHSWHRRWNQKPLKFRLSSLNTDAGPDDPMVFQSPLWALTRAWPSAS